MDLGSVIKLVSGFAWLAVIGLAFLAVTRASRGQAVRGLVSAAIATLVVAILLTVVGVGLVFVQPDARGVVISQAQAGGVRPDVLPAGLHWVVPFIEQVKTYSTARQTYTMSAATNEGAQQGDDSIRARTKDGQEVFIDASVIYSVDPAKVVQLHLTWKDSYQDNVVRPLARGIIRDVASQYGVEEIVSSKRVELEQLVSDGLFEKLGENDLIMVDFILRDIHFTPEYAAAVEQKQIAEQQAQQAKFVVESKKQEAEQARQVAEGQADAAVIAARGAADARVIQAEAEAKALQLVADVLKENPSLLQYQYITKLSPNVQVMLVPSGAPFILPQLQPAIPQ
jgi:regulator of protease activity HflC (stomatin/prohibitin superfamily)